MKKIFHKILKVVTRTQEFFLDIVFPKRCVGRCGKEDCYLCEQCAQTIRQTGWKNETFTLFPYRDPKVRRLVWLLKYQGIKEIGQLFGDLLYESAIEDLTESLMFSPANGKILIIPVPLAKKRLRQRGFNQAEIIARSFASGDRNSFQLDTQTLYKTRDTESQVSLRGKSQRLKNLANAFKINKKRKLKGKTIILIDDVVTTGATLEECARCLRKKGARRVIKMASAHG